MARAFVKSLKINRLFFAPDEAPQHVSFDVSLSTFTWKTPSQRLLDGFESILRTVGMKLSSKTVGICFAIAGFFIFGYQSWTLASSDSRVLANAIPDDAYYYIKTAFNFAKTGNMSFDGVNPTNGVHPLWFWVCSLLAKFCESPEQLLRVALLVSSACVAMVPVILVRNRSLGLSPLVQGVLVGTFLSLPATRFIGVQTLEVGLYAAFLSAFFLKLQDAWDCSELPIASLLTLGCFFAAATLARLDCLLFTLSLFVCGSIWKKRLLLNWKQLAVVLIPLVIGVGVWFLFCFVEIGYISHDSSTVKRIWIEQEKSQFGMLRLRNFKWGLLIGIIEPAKRVFLSPGVWLGALACLSWIGGSKNLRLSDVSKSKLTFGVVTAIAAAVQSVGSRYLSADQFWWYMTPGYVALLYILTILATAFSGKFSPVYSKSLLALLPMSALLITFVASARSAPRYNNQASYIDRIQEVDAMIPPGSVIGAWNSGIFGVYSKNRVVNLDGLVNHSIQKYYQNKNYEKCFAELGIDYVFDWEALDSKDRVLLGKPRAEFFSRVPLPLTKIKDFPEGAIKFVLYRVLR